MIDAPADICQNCGTAQTGIYCSQCGQKFLDQRTLFSVPFIMKDFFQQLTNWDSKFFSSFFHLLFRPGKLSVTYEQGQRERFVKPVQLFLLSNLIYFLIGANVFFSVPFSYLNSTNSFIHTIAEKKAVARGLTLEDYAKRFNAKNKDISKTLLILIIPLFAFVLLFTFWSNKLYWGQHLLFATHFLAFEILLVFTVLPLILNGAAQLTGLKFFNIGGLAHILMVLIFSVWYLHRSALAYYGQDKWLTLVKSLFLLLPMLMAVIYIYRLLLFFIINGLI